MTSNPDRKQIEEELATVMVDACDKLYHERAAIVLDWLRDKKLDYQAGYEAGLAAKSVNGVPAGTADHEWVPSTLGHGWTQCRKCYATYKELAALGKLDHCEATCNG